MPTFSFPPQAINYIINLLKTCFNICVIVLTNGCLFPSFGDKGKKNSYKNRKKIIFVFANTMFSSFSDKSIYTIPARLNQ
ncbi:hypothetical protein Hanom_Chr04g00383531 [Helianthus anomalus]